jgi:hypothetical protein
MKRHGGNPDLSASRSGSEVLVSQPQKRLTERLAHLPQVCLVFGEVSPQFGTQDENFKG